MKVLIIDKVHHALHEILERAGHQCLDISEATEQEVRMALPFAEILVLRSRISIGQDEILSARNLKIIARPGSGIEHIDKEFAHKNGIRVVTSPEGNRQSVAEHALAMLLTLFNRIIIANSEVKQGKWDRKSNQGIELSGKTIGLIGFGNTGSAFAEILSGFDVKILAFDKYKSGFPYEATMERLFESCDIVSLHIPLTNETTGLVSNQWLSQFKKPVYLINTSRGPIAQSHALLQGLNNGQLKGVCLDVLDEESENLTLPELSQIPQATRELIQHQKAIVTPHIAGLTEQSYEKLSKVLAEKILAEI